LLLQNQLDALVAPTGRPAWVIDLVNGDHDTGSAATLPAVAGMPHLSVPMGEVDGLPVGLSFIGPAWSEQRLLGFGAAFEQVAGVRPRPNYLPTAKLSATQEALLSPVGR
jgi:amidase